MENETCKKCPKEIQDNCYKNSLKTNCKIPFYQRSGYPKSFTFLLKTPRKIDGEVVPRGFVTVPMVTPETVLAYDKIKAKNIVILEKQEDNLFRMKDKIINDFLKKKGKDCITLKGSFNAKADNRKYAVCSIKVIEAYLYEFIKAQRKYTVKEIEIMTAVIKQKLEVICMKKNEKLFGL